MVIDDSFRARQWAVVDRFSLPNSFRTRIIPDRVTPRMNGVQGAFVVFEGGDGVGKSTQAGLLAAWLSSLFGFGLSVDSFWWGVLGALVLGLISWLIGILLRPIIGSKNGR